MLSYYQTIINNIQTFIISLLFLTKTHNNFNKPLTMFYNYDNYY
jgi:hypothetical protein